LTIFRPCIDIHQGKVKQIVGSTLSAQDIAANENFVSDNSSGHFASMYKKDALKGGHVIMLGPGNESAAKEALGTYPGGLHIGGGITPANAMEYLDAGASHIIVTSWIFPDLELDYGRLVQMEKLVGKGRLVLDLSCKKQGDGWYVAKDKWCTVTQVKITPSLIAKLETHCAEFLIHAADVEGKMLGIDMDLVTWLASIVNIPVTYAGGASSLGDLKLVRDLSQGKIDLTIGSALDIFGGSLVKYKDCVEFNKCGE
jgi:phosphoribosylformimino-5-aminoimidazole carboxamide ribotide isomerase